MLVRDLGWEPPCYRLASGIRFILSAAGKQPSVMSGIKDSVVLITGASSGIGAEVAEEFARWGARLALTGRHADRLQDTVTKCQHMGVPRHNIFAVTGDVTEKEDVEKIMADVIKYFGRLDILINNAGATRVRNMETCEVDDLDWVYSVLVRSVFLVTKAALPHLEKTKGCIVNMSSLAGLRPLNYALPYSVCKHMVDHFTKAAAVELGPKGIRMNSVNPAAVKTAMFSKPGGPGGDPDKAKKYLDWCARVIPIGRIGYVEEVARTVLFLASQEASFISGVNFPIDGGYSNTTYVGQVPSK